MKVCVIGAGVSGLCAIKELKDEGHEVICFEKGKDIGGIFSYHQKENIYDSTILTSSNYFVAFSSLAPRNNEPFYQWTKNQYSDYLHRYVRTFELLPHIQFNSKVVGISFKDEMYSLEVVHEEQKQTLTFDAIAVCSGQFQIPRIPEIKNREQFQGEIVHACEYRNSEKFRGKKVLCVGLGESGADIVHEIAGVAQTCQVALRRYPSVIPRFINGQANDSRSSRLLYSIPYQDRNAFYMKGKKRQLEKKGMLNNLDDSAEGTMFKWARSLEDRYAQAPVKNEVFVHDVVEKRVQILLGEIESFQSNAVKLSDGSTHEVDVVMFCTGYHTCFSMFADLADICHVRQMYKHMIHPKLGKRIGFIGWARPSTGGIPACSEMQSRYFALLCSDKKELPDEQTLTKMIEEENSQEASYFFLTPYVHSLVVWGPYMDSLARLIGCKPRLFYWNLKFMFKMWCGTQISYQYRLRGPHAQPAMAKKIIKKLPLGFSIREMIRLSIYSLWKNTLQYFGIGSVKKRKAINEALN